MPTPRTPLKEVMSTVLSAYGHGGVTGVAREKLIPLAHLGQAALFVPKAAMSLAVLDMAVLAGGGDMRITDGNRPPSVQADARKKYESGEKKAYVARPGYSMHGAGRAIDIDLSMLKMDLSIFWKLAAMHGWSPNPSVKKPDPALSEAWHFDYWGPWAAVYDRLGYSQAAMCATLDIGVGSGIYTNPEERFVQAQLHRAGYNCGKVDGLIGSKTKAALSDAGVALDEDLLFSVSQLPDSVIEIWPGA